ncbi:MAG: superoxide dismutase [Parachlamydiaceae bacterium]
MPAPKFELPRLPYDFAALEPVISAEIMELHYDKHHRAYVTNLNKALEVYAEAEQKGDLEGMAAQLQAIRFNGGGNINHTIFWHNLAPASQGGGQPPEGALAEAIKADFDSLEKLIELMSAKATALQGSGWAWLGLNKSNHLEVATCDNQDSLLATKGLTPLLGIDVWEHAYYLQYKNVRPDYVKAIWQVINWKDVSERYAKAKK